MSTTEFTRNRTRDLVYCAMFAVLMAICSWISIPAAVPFTLQTFGVFLTVGILGGKCGSLAVFVYLLLGAVGIPVFSGFKGGIGALFGTTGGYIVGFLLLALVMWGMEAMLGKKSWVLISSMLLGLIVCYAFGTAWFMLVYAKTSGAIGIMTALSWCVFPFLIPDLIKMGVAFLLAKRIANLIRV